MNRNAMRHIQCVVLLIICCGLPLSTFAAPPKPALIRDVDRAASAGAMLDCNSTADLTCQFTTPVPAGKRFVSSYISYNIIFGASGIVPVVVVICSSISCGGGGGRYALLPVAAVTGGNVFSTGTPITFVFEAGETPFFRVGPNPAAIANAITVSILGHFEDL
jgi:hypothetical protein